jgi:hypothetical protein
MPSTQHERQSDKEGTTDPIGHRAARAIRPAPRPAKTRPSRTMTQYDGLT